MLYILYTYILYHTEMWIYIHIIYVNIHVYIYAKRHLYDLLNNVYTDKMNWTVDHLLFL